MGRAKAAASAAGCAAGAARITPAALVWKVEPEYSDEARRAKIQGVVILLAEIGPDGRAHNLRLRSGLGLGLDERAMEAVLRWKFRPGARDGVAVSTSALIEVNFRLL